MSKSQDLKLEQIRLSLSDYQSELSAIDEETIKERERILHAIQAEEIEIKSLLEQYRNIKRQKEVDTVRSSYNNLSNFKQTLLSKINLETEADNDVDRGKSAIEPQSTTQAELIPTMEGGAPKKNIEQPKGDGETNQKIKVIELINFIEGINADYLVKLYPADVIDFVPTFEVNNTTVKNGLLEYYRKRDVNIYNALLKLYQKPELKPEDITIPNLEELSPADKKYHDFLQNHYPKSLPFFWFLINREKDSIRQVVMEFAVDHIVQTNTLDNDPSRQELTLELSELIKMNDRVSLRNFLRDIFLCFHPRRVSQKSNSRNKYFDYISQLIRDRSTLENPEALQIWNYMLKCGYNVVFSPEFTIPEGSQEQNGLLSSNTNGLL